MSDQGNLDNSVQDVTSATDNTGKASARKPINGLWTYILIGLMLFGFLMQFLSKQVLGFDLPLWILAKINHLILRGELWRLITPVFLHANIFHLLSNLYALYVLGRGLESFYGRGRFLLLFFLSAFGGNALSFMFSANPSVGASTAIFGLLVAEIIFVWQNRAYLNNSRDILINLGVVLAINLGIGIGRTNIDLWGHLGGLVAGLIFAIMAGPKIVPGISIFDGQVSLRDERSKAAIVGGTVLVLVFFSILMFIFVIGGKIPA